MLKTISKVAREEYGLAGAVQHGASTLPPEYFGHFPDHDCAEIHLATDFMNTVYDHPAFPYPLKREIERWLDENAAEERKSGETQPQFLYKTRKKAIGPYKEQVWNLPDGTKGAIRETLEEKFTFLFEKLRVGNTRAVVAKYVKPVSVYDAARSRRRGAHRLRARRPGGRLMARKAIAPDRRGGARPRPLPAKMTAVVKTKSAPGPSATEIRTVPVPVPGQAEVLIKVIATAVCGSDKHIYQWDASMAGMVRPPRIYGHEFCGEIVAFGPGGKRPHLELGQYVSAEMHVTCGACRPCRTGRRHICENTTHPRRARRRLLRPVRRRARLQHRPASTAT